MIAAGGSRAVRFRSRKPVVVDRVQQARRRAIALVPPQPAQVAQGEVTAKIARRRKGQPPWRIYEVPISYSGRTYEEGKKIGMKDGFQALYCIFRFWLAD